MSKQAQLADGTILEFPDETPQIIMDATVRRHVAQAAAGQGEAFAAKYPTSAELGGVPGSVAPQPPTGGSVGPATEPNSLAALTGGVGPAMFGERISGPLIDLINQAQPAGAVRNPKAQLPALSPQQEIGSKAVTIGSLAPLVTGAAGGLQSLLPTTERAGKKFETIMNAAHDVPIRTDELKDIVGRAKQLKATGSTMPKVVSDVSRALDNPRPLIDMNQLSVSQGMPYSQGRDFATNAGRLSATERLATNPPMRAQVAKLAGALKDANREAAASVGMGDLYDEAMKEYRAASTLKDVTDWAKKWGLPVLAGSGLVGSAARSYMRR